MTRPKTTIAATDVPCPTCHAPARRTCYPAAGQSPSYAGRSSHGTRHQEAKRVRALDQEAIAGLVVPLEGHDEQRKIPAPYVRRIWSGPRYTVIQAGTLYHFQDRSRPDLRHHYCVIELARALIEIRRLEHAHRIQRDSTTYPPAPLPAWTQPAPGSEVSP